MLIKLPFNISVFWPRFDFWVDKNAVFSKYDCNQVLKYMFKNFIYLSDVHMFTLTIFVSLFGTFLDPNVVSADDDDADDKVPVYCRCCSCSC